MRITRSDILDIDNDEEIFLSTSFPSIIPLVLGLMITRDIGGRSQIFFFLLWHSSSFSHLKSLATFLFYQRKSQFFSLSHSHLYSRLDHY